MTEQDQRRLNHLFTPQNYTEELLQTNNNFVKSLMAASEHVSVELLQSLSYGQLDSNHIVEYIGHSLPPYYIILLEQGNKGVLVLGVTLHHCFYFAGVLLLAALAALLSIISTSECVQT